MFATEGKDAETVSESNADVEEQEGKADQEEFCLVCRWSFK